MPGAKGCKVKVFVTLSALTRLVFFSFKVSFLLFLVNLVKLLWSLVKLNETDGLVRLLVTFDITLLL